MIDKRGEKYLPQARWMRWSSQVLVVADDEYDGGCQGMYERGGKVFPFQVVTYLDRQKSGLETVLVCNPSSRPQRRVANNCHNFGTYIP